MHAYRHDDLYAILYRLQRTEHTQAGPSKTPSQAGPSKAPSQPAGPSKTPPQAGPSQAGPSGLNRYDNNHLHRRDALCSQIPFFSFLLGHETPCHQLVPVTSKLFHII